MQLQGAVTMVTHALLYISLLTGNVPIITSSSEVIFSLVGYIGTYPIYQYNKVCFQSLLYTLVDMDYTITWLSTL